jgi:hypothetical protein
MAAFVTAAETLKLFISAMIALSNPKKLSPSQVEPLSRDIIFHELQTMLIFHDSPRKTFVTLKNGGKNARELFETTFATTNFI